ncbi:MAG: HypC/HybG/HupF family hydrogenase formation chaperone [Conexibacter sp.]
MSAPDLVPAQCHCVTCSDEGVPMRVLALADDGLARCAAQDGGEATVETALVAPVAVGELLLVHAGVALVALRPAETAR